MICIRCGEDHAHGVKINKEITLIYIAPQMPVKEMHKGYINEFWCSNCFTYLLDKYGEQTCD